MHGRSKCVKFVDVRSAMTRPKTAQEQEARENLISIREDLWSGEKTREQIEKELHLDDEYSEHLERFFKGKK